MSAALQEIERSGLFSNYGPVNTRFEAAVIAQLFEGEGSCLTVCNATTGLMIAIRAAAGWKPSARRYALMPSYTFAATAHAALWCGLTPLLCDVDPETWTPDAAAEERLLARYRGEIAVVVPYATFGNGIDLDRYSQLSAAHDVPIVVDAAASLGSKDAEGRGFGTGSQHPLVYSLHATKTFATAEAGLIYCTDHKQVDTMRKMANFGFGQPRSATMPGLNAKLSEIGALLGLAKLAEFDGIVAHREALAAVYREALPNFTFQRLAGQRHAFQFVPVLVPPELTDHRDQLVAEMGARGVGLGKYFSPHLAEQPFFKETCLAGELPVTEGLARRSLSLPMADGMTRADVTSICEILLDAVQAVGTREAKASE